MWLHRECVDTIEGICSDGLMADADGLLVWKPDERGAASNYRDLIVLCRGPCVSHPRREIRRESRVESRYCLSPEVQASPRECGGSFIATGWIETHAWMDGYFPLEFVWGKKPYDEQN